MIKIIKIKAKSSLFPGGPRGCDVALRATWQRHAGPRSGYAVYIYIYVLHILYIGRVFKPLNPLGVINPMGFTNLFRVGLKSDIIISISGYVADGGALDQNRDEDRTSMRWTRGPPDLRSTHMF